MVLVLISYEVDTHQSTIGIFDFPKKPQSGFLVQFEPRFSVIQNDRTRSLLGSFDLQSHMKDKESLVSVANLVDRAFRTLQQKTYQTMLKSTKVSHLEIWSGSITEPEVVTPTPPTPTPVEPKPKIVS